MNAEELDTLLPLDPDVAGLPFEPLMKMMLSMDRDTSLRAAGEILDRALERRLRHFRHGRNYDLGEHDNAAVYQIVVAATGQPSPLAN